MWPMKKGDPDEGRWIEHAHHVFAVQNRG
jgi:hypothetical protein